MAQRNTTTIKTTTKSATTTTGRRRRRTPPHPNQRRPQGAQADRATAASTAQATSPEATAANAPPPGSDMFGHTPEQRELMASNSIGAQIILDYNGDGSLGARGGAGGTIEENTMIRDAHLIAVGLDPTNPSGPPTGEPWGFPPEVPRQAMNPASIGLGPRHAHLQPRGGHHRRAGRRSCRTTTGEASVAGGGQSIGNNRVYRETQGAESG